MNRVRIIPERGEVMSDMKMQVLDNGPIQVSGSTELVDGSGQVMKKDDEMFLCRCGLSKGKPYCDGAHQGKFESSVRA